MNLTTVVNAAFPKEAFAKQHTPTETPLGSLSFRNFSRYARLVVGCIACILLSVPLDAQWNQVWGGNFPGAANTTYNHANWWNNVQPNNPWGDGTQQNTSDSLQNAYLDGNGNLVIALTYTPGAAYPYTSARLTSKYAAGPYGRMDTRIQNPSAQGAGAAFWSLGADAFPAATSPSTSAPSTNGGVPWPYCGELDMMEIQSVTANHNGSTLHGSNYGTDDYVSATVNLTPPATFDNSFHIFTTQWEPFHFYFYLDGSATPYGDIDIADTAFNDTWELNQPINFILSSGIGGNGGTPGTTGFPSNMTVSYVNYSQWAAGAPAAVTGLTATVSYSNAVSLSWNASSTSGVTYDIYASTTPGTTPSQFDMVAQNVSGTTYQHTGLAPNTTYYYTVMAANFGGESSAATAKATTQAPGNSTGMQLSAGGWAAGTYMNSSFVVGGNTNAHLHVPIDTSLITTTPAPQQVYDSERWGAAAWTITGLTPGAGYNVNLHFVETTHTGPGQRNFNVSLNSETVLTNFDIYAAAGGMNKAINREFYTKADENGIIELQTQYGSTNVADLAPTINGIEIIPGSGSNAVGATPGTTTDLAINSGGPAVGNFVADEDMNGGDTAPPVTTTVVTAGVANAAPAAVYQTERYVPFTYVLTGLVADATYNVNMHFAETYWTAAGKRIFNVAINGSPALTNLDVYALVGPNKALVEQIPAKADMYGQIIVQFLLGAADQPFIDGIEAIETAVAPTAPAAPTGLAGVANGAQINLTWSASSTAGVTYTVYRSSGSSGAVSIASGLVTTAYADTTAVSGSTYTYYVVAVKAAAASANSNQVTVTAGGGTANAAISINAGGGASAGFAADEDFTGGGTYSNATPVVTTGVPNAALAAVYQDEREGVFTYTIPGFKAGSTHTVRLHFAELYFSKAGQRVFNAAINGTKVLSNFDIVVAAGSNYKAVVESFTAVANSSGQIVISFTAGTVNQPAFSALQVF